ncbi:DsbA family protein [Rhizobium jaguaris]|uniref:DsbA family protein n=1 Tax=Rhizobium jaguaris TaxID=1312183 RepID=UPI0039BFE6AB
MGTTDYAHKLLAYATESGVGAHAWKRMFEAHFGEGREFWTIDQVASFAPEIGLDADVARQKLGSGLVKSKPEDDGCGDAYG